MSNQWQQAIDTNRQLIDEFAPDVEAWNRLGKAYAQLGRISDAREAYEESLKIDGSNTIALRNTQRLAALKDEPIVVQSEDAAHADPAFFIEETGKTVRADIFSDAPKTRLALVTAGDMLGMRREGDVMVVTTYGGERLGPLDAKLSSRLAELQGGGNQYAIAAIAADARRRELRVLVRELRQSPQMAGRVSFPPETSSPTRAYIRGSTLIHESRDDEDDESGDDTDGGLGDEEELGSDSLDFAEDTADA